MNSQLFTSFSVASGLTLFVVAGAVGFSCYRRSKKSKDDKAASESTPLVPMKRKATDETCTLSKLNPPANNTATNAKPGPKPPVSTQAPKPVSHEVTTQEPNTQETTTQEPAVQLMPVPCEDNQVSTAREVQAPTARNLDEEPIFRKK